MQGAPVKPGVAPAPKAKAGGVNLARVLRDYRQIADFPGKEGLWAKTVGDQYDVVYVMLRAASGTAYEGGLLFFTIEPNRTFNSDSEPHKYPYQPPRVLFYSVYPGYIHENLYAPTMGGKVCMSILGTWPGGVDEQWVSTLTFEKIMLSVYGIMDLKSNGSFYTGYKTRTPVTQLRQKMLYGAWHGIYQPIQEGRANPVGLAGQTHTIDFCSMFAEEIRGIYPQQRTQWLKLLEGDLRESPRNLIEEVKADWRAEARTWMTAHTTLTSTPAPNQKDGEVP